MLHHKPKTAEKRPGRKRAKNFLENVVACRFAAGEPKTFSKRIFASRLAAKEPKTFLEKVFACILVAKKPLRIQMYQGRAGSGKERGLKRAMYATRFGLRIQGRAT